MRLLQWLSPRARRARQCVRSHLVDSEGDLFLLGSLQLHEAELVRHLGAIDDFLARGESFEVGVVPGHLVWEVTEGETDDLRGDLRALSERVCGIDGALVQTWAGGRLVRNAYRITAHTCLLTLRADCLLWRRTHSLCVVDSRSSAGKAFNPWRSAAWVA